MKQKLLEGKKLEWMALVLFAVAYAVISAFHEPWFDEAQAWQIAKCASLKELLFEIPHYEGHPPLWHLILAVPAKLGIPFEIGLKTVGFIITASSVILLLFRSTLPRPARLALPFTYFFFYQYGIVVRPYGLMLFFLLLLGMNLADRKKHPWRVMLIMAVLCLTSAYGILFAGGISSCIVWDIWRKKGFFNMLRGLFRDAQTASLIVLLVFALLLIIQIRAMPDAWGANIPGTTSLILRLFCAFFTFPVECFFSTSSWFGIEQVSMQNMSIPIGELILYSTLGVVLWFTTLCASSRKTLKYLLVPYVLYTFFAAAIYFSTHHMGMVFLLFLFWAEYISRTGDAFAFGKELVTKISQTERDAALLKKALMVVCGASLVIPLYWCISAEVHDIQYHYSSGRYVAKFIKEHQMDKGNIFCQWGYGGSLDPHSEGKEDYVNTYIIGDASLLNAYFDRNIVYNLNFGKDNEAYVHHRTIDYDTSRIMIAEWKKAGAPDVIIGRPFLDAVFEGDITYDDYSLVFIDKAGFVWKNEMSHGTTLIYVRNDLLETFGVEAVYDRRLDYILNGVPISDEMIEQIKKGVPAEEVLKPYLDIIFGEEK